MTVNDGDFGWFSNIGTVSDGYIPNFGPKSDEGSKGDVSVEGAVTDLTGSMEHWTSED